VSDTFDKDLESEDDWTGDPFGGEPVIVPIENVLDLHFFQPKEIRDVVREYLDAAYEEGFREVRLIHGRGIGVQRKAVRKILEADPRVKAFGDAPAEAGGWGATWVEME
jgi:dsDNA-specific endonuclease/ATPase MutS2